MKAQEVMEWHTLAAHSPKGGFTTVTGGFSLH